MQLKQQSCPYLDVERTGTTALVWFCPGRLVEQDAIDSVSRHLSTLVEKTATLNLLLNAAPVESMGSALIAKLIRMRNQLQARGGRLIFCRLHPHLYAQLEILRLHAFFGIYQDEQDGAASAELTDGWSHLAPEPGNSRLNG
jgi:anti-anti-sigma factor